MAVVGLWLGAANEASHPTPFSSDDKGGADDRLNLMAHAAYAHPPLVSLQTGHL